jgi:hypothetical protein
MSNDRIKNRKDLELFGQVANMARLPMHGTDPQSIDAFLHVQEAVAEKGEKFSLADASALRAKFEAKWARPDGPAI